MDQVRHGFAEPTDRVTKETTCQWIPRRRTRSPTRDSTCRQCAARICPRPGRAGAGPGGCRCSGGRRRSGDPNAVAVPGLVFDVDESTFTSLVAISDRVPVVIDLWAEWCEPCKQLSPALERVVTEDYGGRLVLAKVDVDANPRLQQAFGVQSIPTVVALVKGQPVPLFQSALPEAQIQAYFDELLKLAGPRTV
jgi:putative thioredoxin